ncbi:MAG TPA: protein kinase, partial [Archangium sp.]|nr:protein kinase [Archangium sp.]
DALDATASRSRPDSPLPSLPSAPARVFEDDELVGYRYRIRGLLGRGGMGEVYEAEDLELKERIALKVLRRELAERPGALELLKREVALARKVSHPNVCRLFDVGFHLRGTVRIPFLSMELLQGEPLSSVLRRGGALPPEEVSRLVRQLAEALGAAHGAGILHRDLKSANVLLVRGRADEAPRAVITDFGLARAMEESSREPAGLAGTPAYMAPEQLEGKPLTPATDLYALGVMMFELLTGERPFRAELDGRWKAVVLRCLERDPRGRFQDTRELLAALPSPAAVRSSRAPRRLRWLPLVLLALGVCGLMVAPHSPPVSANPARARPVPTRRSIAFLGFVNRSERPDTAWVSTALQSALQLELEAAARLRVSFSHIGRKAKKALAVAEAESLPPDTLARLREYLGCELVVVGSYRVTESSGGEHLWLELRIQDAATGATVASWVEEAPLKELAALVSRTQGHLHEALGLGRAPSAHVVGSVLPSQLEALRLYAQGRNKLDDAEPGAARQLLERVIALDPAPALPYAALGSALAMLGERPRALEVSRAAVSHFGQLFPERRLWLEAGAAIYARDWPRAVALYRELFERFPDELEYGYSLAQAQMMDEHRWRDALATVAVLREHSLSPALLLRLDYLEASLLGRTSDFAQARRLAARAAQRAEALGDWQTAALVSTLESSYLLKLGEKERALATKRRAIQFYRRAGNLDAEGFAALETLALLPEEDVRGRLQAAREAESLIRGKNNSYLLGWALRESARYEWALGELRRALRAVEESLASYQASKTRADGMESWTLQGGIHHSLGNLDAAEASFTEMLRLAREQKDAEETARGLTELAELFLNRGDLARARGLLEEAKAGLRGSAEEQAVEKAVALAHHQARLAFEEERLDEAQRLADEAVTAVKASAVPEVHLLRARVFLARGSPKDASLALLQAGEPTWRLTHLGLRIQRARLRATSGTSADHEAALRSLQEVLAEARRLEWFEGQLEARLVLGELELASGRTGAGVARLRALEREAKQRGWGLWAQRAAAARQ